MNQHPDRIAGAGHQCQRLPKILYDVHTRDSLHSTELSRTIFLNCNPETNTCNEPNLIILCIQYLMPDCLLNSLVVVVKATNYATGPATRAPPTATPGEWRRWTPHQYPIHFKSHFTRSQTVYACPRSPEWLNEIASPEGVGKAEAAQGAESWITFKQTQQVSWYREEGPECVCLMWPSNLCSV